MDEQSLNELLECSVCLERLDHTSKVLPCQHTFCRRCLLEIVSTKRELRCPECRTIVDTPVQDLPGNILLIRLLEGIKTRNSERARSPHRADDHHGLSAGGVRHLRQGLVGNQPCAKALYNYEGKDHGDLSFKKGDIIILKRQVDENWFHGEFNGQTGVFPASYVQELVPLQVTTPQCRALYDFDFENENEKKDCLCFKKDEILTVIKRVDDNWLEGKKGEKFGIFPISFVEMNDAAKALCISKSRSLELSSKGNLVILPSTSHTDRVPPPDRAQPPDRAPLPDRTQPPERVPPPELTNQSHDSAHHSRNSNTNSVSATPSSQASSASVQDPESDPVSSSNNVVKAMFNYKPQKEDEIELRKGESYLVLEMCQDGWYKGQCLNTGRMGVFPGNYVQKTRGPHTYRPISSIQNVRAKVPVPATASSMEASSSRSRPSRPAPSPETSSSRSKTQSSDRPHQEEVRKSASPASRPRQGEMRKSASPARPASSPLRGSVSPSRQNSSQNAPPITPRASKISSVPSTLSSAVSSSSSSVSSSNQHRHSSAASRALRSEETQGQGHTSSRSGQSSGAPTVPSHSRRGNNSSSGDQSRGSATIPPLDTTQPSQSVVATASGGSDGILMGATGETVPSASKEKKEKKDKDKISLMKRLVSSGKIKKSKPVNDSTVAAAAVDKSTNHTRSGSCPSEVSPHPENQHVKTGSFDSSTSAIPPAKPSKPKPITREKFRCREPYPPQSEIELELKVGDIVFVHKRREDGWYKGTLQRTGKTGLFPGSFVEKCE